MKKTELYEELRNNVYKVLFPNKAPIKRHLVLQDLLIVLDEINPYPETRDEIAYSYKISMGGTLYENSYKWNGDVSGYEEITSIDLLKPISKQDNEVLEVLLEITN